MGAAKLLGWKVYLDANKRRVTPPSPGPHTAPPRCIPPPQNSRCY